MMVAGGLMLGSTGTATAETGLPPEAVRENPHPYPPFPVEQEEQEDNLHVVVPPAPACADDECDTDGCETGDRGDVGAGDNCDAGGIGGPCAGGDCDAGGIGGRGPCDGGDCVGGGRPHSHVAAGGVPRPSAGQLPFTGAPVGAVAAAGTGLLAVAITCILISVRRRRSTCEK
ncbi:hypothetical protein [Planotetraspora phitsanulokensis]|uniref:hypothetical protein n=1 Tax=Planotetraspora phitsanulokensis TaxID=575192 RepID=UPI0019515B82|nr:hypothetical protein [Planotetraspora phitsanulokensis]